MKTKHKVNLYVDADDTVLQSSEAVIQILNTKNGTNKSINDLRDWGYKSIDGSLKHEDVEAIYNSPEFFSIVETNPGFDKMIEKLDGKVNVTIVTKGRAENLELKRQYFTNRYDDVKFCGILFDAEDHNFNKSMVDMRGGICIDDRVDCLRSCNANVKILILNNRRVPWARPEDCVGIENLYIVNTWDEVSSIVEFAISNDFFMDTLEEENIY